MSDAHIVLLGDYSPAIYAHTMIPEALRLAALTSGITLTYTWLRTRDIPDDVASVFKNCQGIWVTPGSPYENETGVFACIRYAREHDVCFLGSCGGFQHALIEFARNVLQLTDADHAETNAQGSCLVIAPLICSLVGQSGNVVFDHNSPLISLYGAAQANESYHCNYGVNAEFVAAFDSAGFKVIARDDGGDVRAMYLPNQHFHYGSLFQPERSAVSGVAHPLICAFVRSCAARD